MRRVAGILMFMLSFAPRPSCAIGLHWMSGLSEQTFTSAICCTLVVQADQSEGLLPTEWRLLWVADSCEIRPLPLTPEAACQEEVAEVASVSDPTTPAELAASVLTARFCSAAAQPASAAWFVFDLAAGSRGKFRLVALDPSDPDSNRVLQSAVATFNGGSDAPFPPVILRTTTVHRSTAYQLTALGAGLAETSALKLVAPNGSWDLPLSTQSQSDAAITATAAVAAVVPACVVQAETEDGRLAPSPLPAEPVPALEPPEPQGASCQRSFVEDLYPLGMIQPKDFAFVPGGWTPEGIYVFHLFYIRQNQETKNHPGLHGGIDSTEKNIGHVVSNSLVNWDFVNPARDTMAIKARRGMFDGLHVWAPSIVRRGLTYYMFYTGVDSLGDQRMGLATSTDLFNWAQQDNPIFDFTQLGPWATPEVEDLGFQAQFRDPFVMPDPDVPGDWLMYFVTISELSSPATIVGFARSHGDFSDWFGDQPLYRTQHPTGARAESPHVFARDGRWWLFYTAAEDVNPRVFATYNDSTPTDITTDDWSLVEDINELIIDEFTGEPTYSYVYWKGSELLEISSINDVSFLAAYNDQVVGISYTLVRAAQSPYLFEEHCPLTPLAVASDHGQVPDPRLSLVGPRPARVSVRLRIELPSAMFVHLAVYDVAGRRVRTLANGSLPAGPTELAWDGRDDGRAALRSGLYFASLRAGADRRSVRFPLIR